MAIYGHKMDSMACAGHLVDTKSGSTAGWALWLDVVISSALQMAWDTVWDLCPDTIVGRNWVCQNLSAGCWKPCSPSPSLSDPQWPSLADVSYDPYEMRLKQASQEACASVEEGRCPLWALFSHWRNYRPRVALSVQYYASLGWGWGKIWSKWNNYSHPSNEVPVHLCAPRGYFSLTLMFRNFYNGVLSMNSC